MFAFAKALQSVDDIEGVFDRWMEELKRFDVVRASYHLTPSFGSQIGPDVRVFHYGFNDELVELYSKPDIRKSDPIPDAVMRLGRPRTWRRMLSGLELTEDQKAFVEAAGALGFNDGFGIPLFGPNGRESYSSFDIGRRIEVRDERLMLTLVALGTTAHSRICTIVREHFMEEINLTPRENEVLGWIASSKSIGDIATILNLSNATVDTYMRRLYSKLGAHNRMEAVKNAMTHGLVRI